MQELFNFVLVLITAVGITSSLGVLYASGLRLWAEGALDEKGNANLAPRIGSVLCFIMCVSIVLFALWLMVPFLH